MTTKILVTAGELQKLLGQDALVELTNNAIAQIAGRVTANLDRELAGFDATVRQRIKAVVDAQLKSVGQASYTMSEATKGQIRLFLHEEVVKEARVMVAGQFSEIALAQSTRIHDDLLPKATQAVQKVVDKASADLKTQIRDAVNAEVSSILRGLATLQGGQNV